MRLAHPRRRAVFAIGLAALAVVLLLLATQALWLGPIVAHELATRSHRTVRIDSMWIGLSGTLQPVVHLRRVHIDNAPWAQARQPLLDAGELTATLSWRTLFAERRLITLVVLRDARVDLERRADGLRNWRLLDPDNRAPGRYRVLTLQAERSSLHLAMGNVDLELDVTATANTDAPAAGDAPRAASDASPAASKLSGATRDGPLPLRLDFTGRWRAVPFVAQVATGPTLSFYDRATSFALRGSIEAGAARLDAQGSAASILFEPAIDARVAVEAKSMAAFEAFFGARMARVGPLKIAGQLHIEPHRYALSEADATLGRTDLHGTFAAGRESSRTDWRADLRSDRLDIDDWRWIAEGTTPAAAVVAASRAATASTTTAGAGRWQGATADVRYAAKAVHVHGLPALQGLAVEGRLADGRIDVAHLELGLGKGHVNGRGSFDVRDDRRAASAALAWQGVHVEQLLPEQKEKSRVTGILRGDATLSAAGRTAQDLMASVTGRVDLSLAGGTIASLLDAEMGLQGGKIVRSLLGGSEPVALRCATLSATLEHGQGHVRRLVIDSERTRSTGTGSFDLGAGTLDIVLTPEAKQGGLFVLDRSIRLHGPLRKPEKSLVDRRGAAGADAGVCAAG